MVEVVFLVVYVAAGLYVFHRTMEWLDARNNDGDPEGLDAFTAFSIACFWPVVVPIFIIYKLFKG